MSRNPTPESNQEGARTASRAAIIAGVFLTLHIIPLAWRPDPSWGVDFLFFLPTPVQGLFVLVSALLLVPGVRRGIPACTNALPFALWGPGRRVWFSRATVVLIALACFIHLSTARHFLGDGYPLLEILEAGFWENSHRAPLSWALIRALHHICQPYWETAENTYRCYSYASGVLFVLLSFPVAAAIGKTNRDRSVVLAFLLSAGYIQLFFGYVEHYPLFMPGLLLYILMGIHALKQRVTLFGPACVLGVLIALHQAFTVFGPSLAFLAYRAFRQQRNAIPSWKNLLTKFGALCCVPVTAALFVGMSGIGFEAYVSRMGGRNFLPLFAEPGYLSQYRIFSAAHFLDFLNQQLLAAPAVCMALFLVGRRSLAGQPFLAVCAIVPFFFTFLANPEIGAFRDWDVFSLPALPLTLWTAAAFLEAKGTGRGRRFDTAFVVCGAAALHTLAWIGVNASASAAQDRFVHLTNRLSGNAGVNSWMVLGEYHETRSDDTAALQAYKRALKVDPTNSNRWLKIGVFFRERRQYAKAIEYFKKAQQLQPDHAVPYMNLGAAYSDIRQFDKAIEYTRKAVALQPDNATAHVNLGAIYRKNGQVANAIEHLERAAALRPDHADIYGNLGTMYREAGKYTRAIAALKKAVTIRPEDATDCLNLGVVYCDVGQFDNAIEYLGKALEINPRYVLAYTNIGNAYKRQGKYPLAIEYYEKALELQTGCAQFQTLMAIGHTYRKMSEHEKAIPYFQNAIRLDPQHANAHLLLGRSYRALDRPGEARPHFETTLQLEPDHPHADRIRQWLERIRN